MSFGSVETALLKFSEILDLVTGFPRCWLGVEGMRGGGEGTSKTNILPENPLLFFQFENCGFFFS